MGFVMLSISYANAINKQNEHYHWYIQAHLFITFTPTISDYPRLRLHGHDASRILQARVERAHVTSHEHYTMRNSLVPRESTQAIHNFHHDCRLVVTVISAPAWHELPLRARFMQGTKYIYFLSSKSILPSHNAWKVLIWEPVANELKTWSSSSKGIVSLVSAVSSPVSNELLPLKRVLRLENYASLSLNALVSKTFFCLDFADSTW